jgi:uncharacterized membrane protein
MITAEATKKASLSFRWASISLAVAGLLDSLYLGWIKLSGETAACSGIGDCEAVNTSRYSEIGGVPIALLGALAYAFILFFLYTEGRAPKLSDSSRLAIFGFTLVGTLYSAYLTYIEVAVLYAICPFCVVSAIIMTVLFVMSVIRLRLNDMLE